MQHKLLGSMPSVVDFPGTGKEQSAAKHQAIRRLWWIKIMEDEWKIVRFLMSVTEVRNARIFLESFCWTWEGRMLWSPHSGGVPGGMALLPSKADTLNWCFLLAILPKNLCICPLLSSLQYILSRRSARFSEPWWGIDRSGVLCLTHRRTLYLLQHNYNKNKLQSLPRSNGSQTSITIWLPGLQEFEIHPNLIQDIPGWTLGIKQLFWLVFRWEKQQWEGDVEYIKRTRSHGSNSDREGLELWLSAETSA